MATGTGALVFDQIAAANGNVARSRSIQSFANNHAVNFFGLHITADDALYVVEPSGEVHVFDNASALNGSVAPDRTITPNVGATINSTFGVAVARNLLYVGVAPSSSSIVVFNNAETATGTLTPARTLNFALGVGSFCLDEVVDILYVALSDGVILVFDNASTLGANGIPVTPVPDRIMTLQVPTTTSAAKQLSSPWMRTTTGSTPSTERPCSS